MLYHRDPASADEKVDKFTNSDSEQQSLDPCSTPTVTCPCCLGNSPDEEHAENSCQLPIRPGHTE